jgi:hypothetical protein
MTDRYLPVAGVGVLLPAARTVSDLAARLSAGRPLDPTPRRLAADHTDLPPVEAPVGVCDDTTPALAPEPAPEPAPGPARPVRLAGLRRESWLALRAAVDAVPDDLGEGRVGVVWASSTAGLSEYGQTCVDAATLDPRQASPLVASESGYNGPAAAVSIRLGFTGPHLTLTGDRDAGASAVVEAGRMLAERRCRYALVGGSATVSRWRLAGATGGEVPAEGAACVLLGEPDDPADPASVHVRPLRRARLRGPAGRAQVSTALAEFVRGCLASLRARPDAITASAAAPWWRDSSWGGDGIPCWWVDPVGGELGAAGGLQAVVAAVAACGTGAGRVLALAVGDAGGAGGADVVAVEVVSRDHSSRGKEHPNEPL